MLVSELDSLFLSEFDEFQSAYLSNQKKNDFFFDAQTQVLKDLVAQYQLTQRVTEDLLIFKVRTTVVGSNTINLDTDLADYNYLITILSKYTVDGIDYELTADPLLDEEKSSQYAKGRVRYPRYEQLSNSLGERIAEVTPAAGYVQSTVTYFNNPRVIDFNNPADNIPYTDNLVTLINAKAIQLASKAFHDTEAFQLSNTVLNQANTTQ